MSEEWEVIDTYTRKDAIEDGFIIPIGRLGNAIVEVTRTFLTLDKIVISKAIVQGLNEIQKHAVPSQVFIDVGDNKILVASGYDHEEKSPVVTIMLPEDW